MLSGVVALLLLLVAAGAYTMLPCMATLRSWSTCCSVLVTGAWGTGELQQEVLCSAPARQPCTRQHDRHLFGCCCGCCCCCCCYLTNTTSQHPAALTFQESSPALKRGVGCLLLLTPQRGAVCLTCLLRHCLPARLSCCRRRRQVCQQAQPERLHRPALRGLELPPGRGCAAAGSWRRHLRRQRPRV